jgi:hypothetical protein
LTASIVRLVAVSSAEPLTYACAETSDSAIAMAMPTPGEPLAALPSAVAVEV